MNYLNYSDFFEGKMHKFILESSLLNILPMDVKIFLTDIGLPSAIRGQKYEYLQTPKVDDSETFILLGSHKYLETSFLAIKKFTWEVVLIYPLGKPDQKITLYNSSMIQFVTCLMTEDLLVRNSIMNKLLGEYYPDNHEHYSDLLKIALLKIDPPAVEQSIWTGVIEEMHLGVI